MPAAWVLISHGLGEHGGRYQRVTEYLLTAGFAIYAIDHRGHGKSVGARAFVDRFDNAVVDFDDAFGASEIMRELISRDL